MPTILSKYLKALGVPHTQNYADACFSGMAFKNLFGLTRTLEQFGVESRGLRFSDNNEVLNLPTPFLAGMHGDVVIVDSIDSARNSVTYDSVHGILTTSLADFVEAFSGIVLQSIPRPDAKEPDFALHRLTDLIDRLKRPLLAVLLLLLAVYGSVEAGLWSSVFKVLVFGFDLAGIAVCYLLWLKTNGVQSKVADSMCGLTTEHGCDKVLDTRAASFMGIFKWSEVGMGYFAVSLMALVMFPSQWSNLALFNACCLPYTLWSVTYQKFVIKAWCTLCLTVQALLWCLFVCYLSGEAWRGLSLSLSTLVLLACYICGVLLMNLVNTFIAKAKTS